MKTKFLAAAAIGALGLAATSANAAETITITSTPGDAIPAGFTLIDDFSDPIAPGFMFTQAGAVITTGSNSGSAAPPGDSTPYETVLGGTSATLSVLGGGLEAFSFYMGSPDTYNHMTFTFTDVSGATQELTGPEIWCQTPTSLACYGGGGNQGLGYTVTYSFSAPVKAIVFSSDLNSFEFDNLAGVVPEPASWALMIGGCGLAGATLRAKRRTAAIA